MGLEGPFSVRKHLVQAGEYPVRHRSGTIYLRAKVADKIVRISLKTSDLRIAKIKRHKNRSRILRLVASSLSGLRMRN